MRINRKASTRGSPGSKRKSKKSAKRSRAADLAIRELVSGAERLVRAAKKIGRQS
jgi:hypothetical protein